MTHTPHAAALHLLARIAVPAMLLCVALNLSCSPARDATHGGLAGVLLDAPYSKPDVWLTDTQGRRFNFRKETEGDVTLVEFGYTHCPDICPVTVANIAAALAREPYEVASRVHLYFVTQDPERDTPEKLRKWLNSFNSNFVGVVGSASAVDTLARALKIASAAIARRSPSDTTYAVGHASQVVVFTPDNLAHVVYPFGVRQEEWTRDLPKLAAMRQWKE